MKVAPEFSLRGRFLRSGPCAGTLSQLRAEVSSGYLCDGWQHAVFTPMGSVPVKGIFGLPPWDPTQADTYRNMIDDTSKNNLGDSNTLRLEGIIPYLGANGTVGYDIVRLFYAFNAVQGAPITDLVVIKMATLVAIPGVVKIKQDGAGHGPPHKRGG